MNASGIAATVLAALSLISCQPDSEPGKPLESGLIVSGMVWENPRGQLGSNTGTPIEKGSRVDVYGTFLVIHRNDGTKQIEPLSLVTELVIR